VLDRFDSLFFTIPVTYWLLAVLLRGVRSDCRRAGMIGVALLGSTGSIGRSALRVLERHATSSASSRWPPPQCCASWRAGRAVRAGAGGARRR
jgi:hypothetical protein